MKRLRRRIDDILDEALVDGLALRRISMRRRITRASYLEEFNFDDRRGADDAPCRKRTRLAFPPLVLLALQPVTRVDVVRTGGVSIPFCRVVLQERFFLKRVRVLDSGIGRE